MVYKRCNEVLLAELQKQSLGQIRHVTGEMRAISDPFHRYVCSLSYRRYGVPGEICAWLPPEHRISGRAVWEWNRRNWPARTRWQDHLDVFHRIAAGETVLYGLSKLEEMHFSLFGRDLVQLQERHDHAKHTKRVWLLKSRRLWDALLPTVERCFGDALEIPSRMFANFAALLSDPLHLDVLVRLTDEKTICEGEIGTLCGSFGTSFGEVMADLQVAGFINREENRYAITTGGMEFLELSGKDN